MSESIKYKKFMELNPKQQGTLDKAIKLLKPFNKEESSDGVVYFREIEGDELSSEYDCCGDEKCIKKTQKEIKANYGENFAFEEVYTGDFSDHELIERCNVCGKPLNEGLTWVEYELERLENEKLTKPRIKAWAFDLIAIFQSMPSVDCSIEGYEKYQNELGNPEPLKKKLQQREEFVNRVVNFAEKIIKKFN